MNNIARLGLLGAICTVSIAATAPQRELIASIDDGLGIFLLPETIVSIDGVIEQADILFARENTADGTDETTITGKVQVNCETRQIRMIGAKIVKLAPRDKEMAVTQENGRWMDLEDPSEELKFHDRLCKAAIAPIDSR
jgi:hypothetical protein